MEFTTQEGRKLPSDGTTHSKRAHVRVVVHTLFLCKYFEGFVEFLASPNKPTAIHAGQVFGNEIDVDGKDRPRVDFSRLALKSLSNSCETTANSTFQTLSLNGLQDT